MRGLEGRWAVARSVAAVVALALLAWVMTWLVTGYDHREALATATRIENPHGFAMLHDAGDYLATRVAGIVELGLFLSAGVLAWCLRGASWRHDPSSGIARAAFLVFVLAMLAGTYRHGETARACLFLYPYLLLFLCVMPARALDACLVIAVLQTAAQQLTGFFFW
jgi:hypothetical protein